jgi:hypothetical protein
MAGSGTSLIVARGSGHAAYGLDSDPLAVLISKVGTADAKPDRIAAAAVQVLQSARRMRIAGGRAYPSGADAETQEFVRYWFDLRARKQMTAVTRAIRDHKDASVRKFLWCALSRMVIVKDAGVSLARDVSHSRPHKSFTRSPIEPFDAFGPAVARVLSGNIFHGTRSIPKVKMRRGDARNLPFESECVDVVVTSPPYLNAIDYMRGHKLSLVWMGHRISDLRGIRSGSVGSETGDHEPHGGQSARIVRAMGCSGDLPERFRLMVERYVRDIDAVIGEIARVLVPEGKALIVIGDCTVRGIYIRNSSAMRLLAAAHSLRLVSERRRRIPDNRRYLPPPRADSGAQLAKRMRTEIVLSFEKTS